MTTRFVPSLGRATLLHTLRLAQEASGARAASGVAIQERQIAPVKVQEVARELGGVANGGCGGRMVRPPAKACRCRFRPKGGLPPAAGLQDASSGSGQKAAASSKHAGTAAVYSVDAVLSERSRCHCVMQL